jgi:geranylgeranyl reductase family protein
MIYDAIVVGAGPGGALAACELRRFGLSVLVLERARHPRHKSCGGGLSLRVQQVLEPGFQGVVQDVIDRVRFTFSGSEEFAIPFPRPVAYMVAREEFDRYLAKKAVDLGAELVEEEPVFSVSEYPDRVEVQTERGSYQGRYLIGADGANSVVAKTLCSTGDRQPAFSLEADLSPSDGTWEARREVVIELGHSPGGYAWVFPKERHLSVGVAGFIGKNGRPRETFWRFVRGQKRLAAGTMGKVSGYPIPLYHRSMPPLASPRLAVVGDAAQLVDPLFGEGIYYALWSGKAAARCVAEAARHRIRDLTPYDRQVRAELYPEFRSAYWMARLVYSFPYLSFRLFRRHPEVIHLYYRVLRGELSYRGLVSALRWKLWGYLSKAVLRRLGARSRDKN